MTRTTTVLILLFLMTFVQKTSTVQIEEMNEDEDEGNSDQDAQGPHLKFCSAAEVCDIIKNFMNDPADSARKVANILHEKSKSVLNEDVANHLRTMADKLIDVTEQKLSDSDMKARVGSLLTKAQTYWNAHGPEWAEYAKRSDTWLNWIIRHIPDYSIFGPIKYLLLQDHWGMLNKVLHWFGIV